MNAPCPRAGRRRRHCVLVWPLFLALAACGGGGSTTGNGGGGGGGGGQGAPTLTLGGFTGNPLNLPGDAFSIAFTADDDGTAQVTVVLDLDGDPNTTGDQILVFGPVPDAAGNPVTPSMTIPPGTAAGIYTIIVIVDDGTDVTLEAMPTPITVTPALAGVHPSAGSNHYAVVDNRVYFSRNEAADGNQSFSSDGLADGDSVMAQYDASTGVFNQGDITVDQTSINGGESQILKHNDGDTVAFETLEADEGVDIDLDLNQLDRVASFWSNNDTAPIRNDMTGLLGVLSVEGPFLHARYAEALQGPGGTNRTLVGGDADAADDVFCYVDTTLGSPSTAAQSVYWPLATVGPLRTSEFSIAAFYVSEAAQGATDITGDFDVADTVLAIVGYGALAGTPGQVVAFAGVDAMNGIPVRAVDPAAGFAVINTPQMVAYYVHEAMAGGDVNGDGNVAGFVPALYDITGTEFLLPPPSAGQMTAIPGEPLMQVENGMLFFTMSEALRVEGVAGTNNDGDGGLDTRILCWADTTLGAAIQTVPVSVAGGQNMGALQALSLDGGTITRVAPGWFGVVVQEAANGNQDISGNGALDTAFLLVDANAQPPVVHNPQLTTTGAGNIPATGLGSDTGVLVRVLENLNGGDRDGDGKVAETLCTFIPFSSPTGKVFLDAGGDYAHIAGGRIGVTANEALTQEDYDGNGQLTDFVFRVFSTTGGAVQHAGTLSHPMSVPASHIGNLWAFLRNEAAEGRDLNGDSDQADVVLGLWSAP